MFVSLQNICGIPEVLLRESPVEVTKICWIYYIILWHDILTEVVLTLMAFYLTYSGLDLC